MLNNTTHIALQEFVPLSTLNHIYFYLSFIFPSTFVSWSYNGENIQKHFEITIEPSDLFLSVISLTNSDNEMLFSTERNVLYSSSSDLKKYHLFLWSNTGFVHLRKLRNLHNYTKIISLSLQVFDARQ